MKKNDVAVIVLIVILAAVVAYFVSSAVIGTPENDPVKVEVVTPINETFQAPDSRIFNEKAIDPTVEIKGGSEASKQPFSN
jgi:hypothetical protein